MTIFKSKWSLDSLTYLVVQENKMVKELNVKYNLVDSLTELKQVLLKKDFISKIDRALEQIDEVNKKEKIKFEDEQFVSKGIETFEKAIEHGIKPLFIELIDKIREANDCNNNLRIEVEMIHSQLIQDLNTEPMDLLQLKVELEYFIDSVEKYQEKVKVCSRKLRYSSEWLSVRKDLFKNNNYSQRLQGISNELKNASQYIQLLDHVILHEINNIKKILPGINGNKLSEIKKSMTSLDKLFVRKMHDQIGVKMIGNSIKLINGL